MISLTINGQPALLKTGTSFKLTRENPYFTNSGDYTLDVQLPLDGCPENQRIFGALHRPETTKKKLLGKSFPFRLLADGVRLEGKAVVTAVTESDAKVQLLAGPSVLRLDFLDAAGEEKYIDRLKLGNAYDTVWEQHRPGEAQTPLETMRLLCSPDFSEAQTEQLLHGPNAVTDCVCFPVWSQADEAWSNPHEYCYWGDDIYLGDGHHRWDMHTVTFRFPLRKEYHEGGSTVHVVHDRPNTVGTKGGKFEESSVFAPQPYLCHVVERVLAALGYSIVPADNCLRQGWLGQVFIANARGTLDLAGMLPHWTAKAFFDSLRKTFNVTVLVDGIRTRIVSRETVYADQGRAVVLRDVTDEYGTDLDEEGEAEDTTAGNVGYAFTSSCPLVMNLGEEVYGKMEVRRVTGATILDDFQSLTDEQRAASNILYFADGGASRHGIFETTGAADGEQRRYALKEVDLMGPLFRDDDGFDVDNLLDIVPCMMEETIPVNRVQMIWHDGSNGYSSGSVYPVDPGKQELEGGQYGGFHVPYLVTADTRAASDVRPYSLQAAVERDEDTSQEENPKQDVMEVALNLRTLYHSSYLPSPVYEPERTQQVKLPYPIGNPFRYSRMGTGVYKDLASNHFILRDPGSAIHKALDGAGMDIDTRATTRFNFLENMFDPSAVVLLRGKKYVICKLEYTIDEQGVQPLKTGYFYEIGE